MFVVNIAGVAVLTLVFTMIGLATSLSTRAVDPLITPIASDFDVSVRSAALLSSVYSLAFAVGQPLLGPLGDHYGKTVILRIGLCVMVVGGTMVAFSPVFWMLLGFRLLSGLAAGSVTPVTMAVIGDRYPGPARQLAVGRFLTATLSGQLFGVSLSGLLAVTIGWRGVFMLMALVAICAAIGALSYLHEEKGERPPPLRFAHVIASYRLVYRNPKAVLCFGTVFLEGIALFGLTPYVGDILARGHLGGPAQAGIVLAGVGIGGLIFSLALKYLLPFISRATMMATGGVLAMAGPIVLAMQWPWPVQAVFFTITGFGYIMLHNCIQVEVLELAPNARASAYAMHALWFFTGQALGPVIFGAGYHAIGLAMLCVNATIFGLTGIIISRFFKRRVGADAI